MIKRKKMKGTLYIDCRIGQQSSTVLTKNFFILSNFVDNILVSLLSITIIKNSAISFFFFSLKEWICLGKADIKLGYSFPIQIFQGKEAMIAVCKFNLSLWRVYHAIISPLQLSRQNPVFPHTVIIT